MITEYTVAFPSQVKDVPIGASFLGVSPLTPTSAVVAYDVTPVNPTVPITFKLYLHNQTPLPGEAYLGYCYQKLPNGMMQTFYLYEV